MLALPIFPGSRPPSIVGERWERCRWQIQRPERVAAVDEGRRCLATKDIRRAPQQGHMSLTSVFGMVARPSAAGGRCSEGASKGSGLQETSLLCQAKFLQGTATGHELARRQWRSQGQAQCVQRSIKSRKSVSPKILSGTANGQIICNLLKQVATLQPHGRR